MESSPTFSPLSGTLLSGTPTSGDSCVVGSAGDGSASLNSDSRPFQSRIGGVAAPSCVQGGNSGYGAQTITHLDSSSHK